MLLQIISKQAYSTNLLQENGFKLLQEDGSKLLQEDFVYPFQNWTESLYLGSSSNIGGLVFDGAVFWCAFHNTSTNLPELWYSSNGSSWTQFTNLASFWNSRIYGIHYANGNLVLIGNNIYAYTSDGGANWTTTATSVPVSSYWTQLAYGNGIYVLYASGLLYKATSISSGWIAATTPANLATQASLSGPIPLKFIDGIFYISGYDTTLGVLCHTSADAVTWTTIQNGISGVRWMADIIKYQNVLYFYAYQSPNWQLRISSDGLATSTLLQSFYSGTPFSPCFTQTANGLFSRSPTGSYTGGSSIQKSGTFFLSFGAGAAFARQGLVGSYTRFSAASASVLCTISQTYGSNYKITSAQI